MAVAMDCEGRKLKVGHKVRRKMENHIVSIIKCRRLRRTGNVAMRQKQKYKHTKVEHRPAVKQPLGVAEKKM
jgi:hypothetical protein